MEDCNQYKRLILSYHSTNAWRELARSTNSKIVTMEKRKCLIHLHGGYYRTLIEKDCGKSQRSLNYKAISRISGTIVLGNSLKSIFKGMINEQKYSLYPTALMKNIC